MTQPVKILLVDDDVTGREVLSLALQERGFHISQAEDGQIALEVLESGTFDVVISDVLMPRMDGFRLCYEVRKNERWKGLPFIIYTGTYTAPEDERLGMEFGANKYLRKTGSVDEVVQAVKEVLSSNGKNPPPEQLGELDVMKVYSERLVGKLEEKNIELEQAKGELLKKNEELEQMAKALRVDISERQKTEEQLRQSEERFAKAFHANPALITLSNLDGTFIDVNESYVRTMGYQREEVIGKKSTDLGMWIDNDRGKAVKILQEKTSLHNYEARIRTKSGEERIILTSAELIELRGKECILGMSYDITERKQAEEMLKELTRKAIETQELERKRIARELHDSVGQMLSAVKFRIQSAGEKIQSQKSKIWKDLSGAWTLLEQSIHEIRRIAHNLRPSVLDDLGLISAVRSMCEEFEGRTSITVNLRSSRFPNRLPPEVELSLFRIIQEVLNNVEQHSRATKLVLQIKQKNSHLLVRIKDNGRGFDPLGVQKQRSRARGYGLDGIRERVATIGGHLELQAKLNKGVEIEIKIPLEKQTLQ